MPWTCLCNKWGKSASEYSNRIVCSWMGSCPGIIKKLLRNYWFHCQFYCVSLFARSCDRIRWGVHWKYQLQLKWAFVFVHQMSHNVFDCVGVQFKYFCCTNYFDEWEEEFCFRQIVVVNFEYKWTKAKLAFIWKFTSIGRVFNSTYSYSKGTNKWILRFWPYF